MPEPLLLIEQIQEMLWRHGIKEQNPRDIAKAMGIPWRTVRYQINRHKQLYRFYNYKRRKNDKKPFVEAKRYKDYLPQEEWKKVEPLWKELGLLDYD